MTHYASTYQFCPMCGHAYENVTPPVMEYHCTNCDYRVFENLIVAASGLIMRNNHQEILLVKRAFEPQKGKWDIPGGFCNPDEHPEESFHRELQEELAVEVEIEKLWNIYAPVPYTYQNRTQHNCDLFYLAHITAGDPTPADDVADYQWFSVHELPSDEELSFVSARAAIKEIQETFAHA